MRISSMDRMTLQEGAFTEVSSDQKSPEVRTLALDGKNLSKGQILPTPAGIAFIQPFTDFEIVLLENYEGQPVE